MKKSLALKKLILISLRTVSIFLVFICSCEKDTGGDQPEIETETGISLYGPNITPHQLVLLKLHKKSASIKGKIADKTLEIKILNDSTAFFLAPDLPLGKQTLSTDLGNLAITVKTPNVMTEKQVFDGVEANLSMLDKVPTITDEKKKALKVFRDNVKKLYNSLTDEQKAEALAVYSANRESIVNAGGGIESMQVNTAQHADVEIRNVARNISKDFNNSIPTNPVYSVNQSELTIISRECGARFPGDVEQQMACSVIPLNHQYIGLERPLIEFIGFSTMTGFAIWLSPVTLGVSTIAGSIAVTVAVYILFTELSPYIAIAYDNTSKFLSEQWILAKEKVQIPKQNINTEGSYSLQNYYQQRTISKDDIFTGELGIFMSMKARIKDLLIPLKEIFGVMPDYINKESFIQSENIEWTVSEISSPNVTVTEIKENRLNFQLKNIKEEDFNYKLHANYRGQRHEVKVDAFIRNGYNDDYTVMFAKTYNPDYSKITSFEAFKEGDFVSVYSNLIYQYKVLYKGTPVTNLSTPSLHNIRQVQFADAPSSSQDIYMDDYGLEFFDELNRRNVKLFFKIKISNEAYDRIAGKTLSVSNSLYHNGKSLKFAFNPNGKLIIDLPGEDFTRETSWNFVVHSPFDYVSCPNGSEVIKESIGAVQINLTSVDVPPFIILYRDGSYGGSGSSPCGDGFRVY
ncbi:hypothetical protein [Sphingobacterium suaedae]|uniref:DUF4369 domain-containing protein n=1 Tax=Sphingobacterium suaedae TaxID=1686402 RepID=A0ABW5KN95_9SPHI